MLIIKNATAVNGDGETIIDNATIVADQGTIVEVNRNTSYDYLKDYGNQVIDGNGMYVFPGIINHHVHCITMGPYMASGGLPISREEAVENQKKHLLQGTTTVMNVDGFATMDEVEQAQKWTPINIKTGTTHLPKNLKAASIADGAGLTKKHLSTTVEQMLGDGAVAIGEVGAGVTLGGAGQDYCYIPRALKQATGQIFSPVQCRTLKEAVLGRSIDPSNYDEQKVKEALKLLGLTDTMTVAQAKGLVETTVLPCFDTAKEGIGEAISKAVQLKAPVLVHNATASTQTLIKANRNAADKTTVIASHSNHPTFLSEEAITSAKQLRSDGAYIDIASLDAFDMRVIMPGPQVSFDLLKGDLVDLISTDYAGGNFDSILMLIEAAVEQGCLSLQKAIRMATSRVAELIPGLAPQRGFIQRGWVADLVLVDRHKISDVRYVIIDGRVVVDQGCFRDTY